MSKTSRRKFTATFKAKVVIESLKEQNTLAELSKKYEVNGVMISRWKKEFLENAASVFNTKSQVEDSNIVNPEKLYAPLGVVCSRAGCSLQLHPNIYCTKHS